jgi:hypothetical protein
VQTRDELAAVEVQPMQHVTTLTMNTLDGNDELCIVVRRNPAGIWLTLSCGATATSRWGCNVATASES